MLVFAHCNFDVNDVLLEGNVFGWGLSFFCWVELFLSVPEGGTDEMQFKNIFAFKILCKFIFYRYENWSFYLDFVNFFVCDVCQLL